MQRSVRYFLLSAAVLAPAGAFGAQIQPVGWQSDCTTDGCDECRQECNSGGFHCNACQNGAFCNAGGQCNMRSTRNDFATNWSGNCGPTGRLAQRGCRVAQTARWCSTTKAFPDAGWAPPTRMPINRTGTGFQSYVSNGGPYAGAPMVYQPTDTTQLGYSYAHVPTWTRNPGMIPPTPIPSNFHGRFCPHNQNCGPGCNAGCMMGGGYVNEENFGPACPDCNPGYSDMIEFQNQVQPAHAVTTRQPLPRNLKPAQPALYAAPQIQMASQAQVKQTARAASNTTNQTRRPVTPNRTNGSQSRSNGASRSQQASGGWFGLPSLREMSF